MALNWYQGQGNSTKKPSATYSPVQTTNTLGTNSGYEVYARNRAQGLDILQGGVQGPNEEDILANDAMRDYWTGAIGNLGNVSQNRQSQFDTQAQRGLANLLSQHKSSQAGTGLIGSRQASNQSGDITQRLAGEYARGVTANNQAELGSASQIQSGLGGVRNVDLQERGLKAQHAKTLADYFSDIGRQEMGWEQYTSSKPEETSWLQDIAPLLGTAAGAFLGGPAGAMIGGSLAGSLAGGGGGGQGGAQMGSNLGQLMMAQNRNSVGGGLPAQSPIMGDYSASAPGAYQASGLTQNPYYGGGYWNNMRF